jgi:hypothetical protein
MATGNVLHAEHELSPSQGRAALDGRRPGDQVAVLGGALGLLASAFSLARTSSQLAFFLARRRRSRRRAGASCGVPMAAPLSKWTSGCPAPSTSKAARHGTRLQRAGWCGGRPADLRRHLVRLAHVPRAEQQARRGRWRAPIFEASLSPRSGKTRGFCSEVKLFSCVESNSRAPFSGRACLSAELSD